VIVDVDEELLTAQLVTAIKALEDPIDPATARAALTAVAIMVDHWENLSGEDDGGVEEADLLPPPLVATKDPTTCGHPNIYNLPSQIMCVSCGASQNPDETWSVW
jgi:hypothetical protein